MNFSKYIGRIHTKSMPLTSESDAWKSPPAEVQRGRSDAERVVLMRDTGFVSLFHHPRFHAQAPLWYVRRSWPDTLRRI